MDKLKPILTHKFWIFGTIALLLPPIGWWSAKGDLTAEITTRQEALQKTFDEVDKGNGPNDSWSTSLAEINKLREQSNQQSKLRVWQEQKDLMVWPDSIAKYMHECEYWASPKEFKIQQLVPNRYMDAYDTQIRKLWHLVEPVPDASGFVDASSKRQVKLDLAAIPRANGYPWDQDPPTFEQIWGGQEDISLLTQLFQAIARVNQGTRSILESHIKVVQQVSLFGGKRGAGKAAAGGDAGAGSAAAGASAMAGMFGSNSAGSKTELTADINLAENFSDLVFASAGAGGSAGAPGGGSSGFSMPTSAGGSEAGGQGGAQQQVDPLKVRAKRYVDNEDALPFRARGFYLKVVMDHRRIPDLLGELLNSRYPVEIVRVQWVAGGGDSGAAGGGGSQAFAANAGGFGAAGFDGSAFGSGADGGAFAGGLDADSIGAGLEGDSLLTDPSVLDPALDPQKKAERIQALAQEAFADTNLATVTVAGLLTLYKPEEAPADPASAEKPAVEVSTTATEKTAAGPSDPAADAAAPMPGEAAPPAAADPNAPPADPAAPADPNADLPKAVDAGVAAPPAAAPPKGVPPEAAPPEAAPPEAAPPEPEKPKPEPPAAKKS